MDCLVQQRAGWEPEQFFDKDELRATGIDAPSFAQVNKSYRYDNALNTIETKDKGEQLYFTLNKNNQITAVHNQNREQERYAYDSCGYLTQQAQAEYGFTRDELNPEYSQQRLIQHNDIYQQGHKLNRLNHHYYRYDNAGRLTEKTEIRDGFRQKNTYYRWNANNQLTGITNDKGEVWYYKYDALGRRISKECPQQHLRIEYLWDGDQLAYTQTFKNGKPHSQRHSVFNGWQLLAQQDHYQQLKQTIDGNFIEWKQETGYAICQPNGQVLALLNPKGRTLWRKEKQTLWGLCFANEYKQPNPLDPQMLFAGQWVDEESGLVYNRFRYYDPNTACYLNSDPIGLEGGSTPYFYVQNPLQFIDPFGLAVCPTLIKDNLGRIKEASATITKEMIGTGTGVNNSARAYAKAMGNQGDDAGHILAKILGGQGGKGNVFSQLSSVNRGTYREFEKSVRKMLEKHDSLDLKWKFNYPNVNSTRPNEIIYDVFHNGKLLDTLTFIN